MEREHLLKSLEELHDDLNQAEHVDSETLARLQTLTDDIQRILDERQDADTGEVEPVTNGLKDLLLKFEAEHPQLSASIGRVADALAAMGI